MTDKTDIKEVTKESGFYEPYSHFSRTLRAWLVGYGVGAPVLIISQENLVNKIIASNQGGCITALFLFGVSVQILAALIYKYSMGYLYASELNPDLENTFCYKLAEWFSDAFWLELIFDLVAVTCFIIATFKIINIVIGN